MTKAEYSYQWFRVDGTAETLIPGATGVTYWTTKADTDKAVKAKMYFLDDVGHAEMLESATVNVAWQTLVCNVGQESSNTDAIATATATNVNWIAQRFTTGNNVNGYRLGRARLILEIPGAETPALALALHVAGEDDPGSKIVDLDVIESSLRVGSAPWFAPAQGTMLDAATDYYLVLRGTNTQGAGVERVSVGGEPQPKHCNGASPMVP